MAGSGRRTSLATLAGAKVDNVPGQSDPLLLTLPLAKLVPTRFNPRRNFGTDEALKEFGLVLKNRQLQPAVVVSRAGYLKLWPDEADAVGDKPYVIANGERRYRASLAIGLPTLNVVHNEGVAASRADFLDAVLSENNDREDLDPIERALGIKTMVDELGGKAKVAEHYEKSGGWVTQQMYLLDLAPELQDLVSAGQLPVRETRALVKLPQEQQVLAWQAKSAERQEAREHLKAPRRKTPAVPAAPAPDTKPESFTAVKNDQGQGSGGDASAPGTPADTESSHHLESPADADTGAGAGQRRREQLPDIVTVGMMPWGDYRSVHQTMRHWMTPEDYRSLRKEIIAEEGD